MRLGRTKVSVTRLGLGTAPLGGLYAPVADEAALRTIDAAWQAGVRFFDTAPLYGHGLAETRLGEALAGRPRDSYVLATKVGRLLRPVTDRSVESAHYKGTPSGRAAFRLLVRRRDDVGRGEPRAARSSIGSTFSTSTIRTITTMQPLAARIARSRSCGSEGVIGAIGAGMNQWQMLQRFAQDEDFDCFLLAGRYTLLDRSAADSFLPLCMQKSISVIAGGVYNSGILADPRDGAKFDYDDAPVGLVAQALRLESVCKAHGVPLKAAAIQFPFTHPSVAAVLTGARSEAELDENLAMLQTPIAPALWNALRDTH